MQASICYAVIAVREMTYGFDLNLNEMVDTTTNAGCHKMMLCFPYSRRCQNREHCTSSSAHYSLAVDC